MSEVHAFIALGANLGDAPATVLQAITDIGHLPQTRLCSQSSLYASAPVDSHGPDYINAVVEVATTLGPTDLLRALQRLENLAGRDRPYRNAPRTLDLDLLLYGSEVIDMPELVVPHPRMFQRAFVLVPLAEIAPDRVSASQLAAVQGQTMTKLLPAHQFRP